MELDAEDVASIDDRGEARPVLRLRENEPVGGDSLRPAREGVDEVEVGALGDPFEERMLAAPDDLVPADVGERRCIGKLDRGPFDDAERVGPVLPPARTADGGPRQIRIRPARASREDRIDEARPASGASGLSRPDAGTTIAFARSRSSGSRP